MAKKNNDPGSVGRMKQTVLDRMRVDSGHEQKSFYGRMMWSVLSRLALNRIEWSGLPDEIDPVLLERKLITDRTIALYKSATVGKPVLYNATGANSLNNDELPSHWSLRSFNGLDVHDSVPIQKLAVLDPRYDRMDVTSIIRYYVEIFVMFDEALRSNLRMQKTPVFVAADEELKLTMSNIVDQYQSGAPTIYTTPLQGTSLRDSVTAVNFNVDYVGDRLLIDRRQAWNDCMTYLGIDNSNQDKRERLVRAEISGNDDQIDNARLVELVPRREFADRLNELYGWNVDVNWTNDYRSANFILDNDEQLQESVGDDSDIPNRINLGD